MHLLSLCGAHGRKLVIGSLLDEVGSHTAETCSHCKVHEQRLSKMGKDVQKVLQVALISDACKTSDCWKEPEAHLLPCIILKHQTELREWTGFVQDHKEIEAGLGLPNHCSSLSGLQMSW